MTQSYPRSLFLGGVALVFFFALASSAHAATLHVRQGGGGDCTTINECIGRMSGGDTIIVHGGDYDELLYGTADRYKDGRMSPIPNGLSESQPTTIMAAPGETVWLRPTAENPDGCAIISLGCTANGSYITFDGINVNAGGMFHSILDFRGDHNTIKNAEFTNTSNCAAYSAGSFNKFINLHIHHNAFYAETSSIGCHGFYVSGSNNLFDRLNVHDHRGYGLQFSCDGCGGAGGGNTIQNSVFYNNTHGGVVAGGANNNVYNSIFYNNGIGIISYHKVIHNTIYNNRLGGIFIGGSPEVRDNIVIGTTEGLDIDDHDGGSSPGNSSNNMCSGSGFGCTVNGNPQFVNPPTDFHLQSGSPAKNAGTDGKDLGVDFNEFGSVSPSPSPSPTPTPTPQPSGSICSQVDQSYGLPQGFGSPMNFFTNPVARIIDTYCNGANRQLWITKPSSIQYHYTYNTAYQWNTSMNPSQWTPVTLTCHEALVANVWCPSSASANLNASFPYVIAYTCAYVNNAWKCGCRDAACTTPFWQLQRF